MRLVQSLRTIDVNSMGLSVRVIMSGTPFLEGKTIAEKIAYMEKHYDWIRTTALLEPRGFPGMMGAVLTEPTVKGANYGVFYLTSAGYMPMSGVTTIGTVTAIVQSGMVSPVEPATIVNLDTAAGLIQAKAYIEDGEVTEVSIENVPSFLYKKGVEISIPDFGKCPVDISYGGAFYGIIDADSIGLEMNLSNKKEMSEVGHSIIKSISQISTLKHPVSGANVPVFAFLCREPKHHGHAHKNVDIYADREIDRSPNGTGTSARMAQLFSKGKLQLNEEHINQSLVGTILKGKLIREVKVGSFDAVVPQLFGKAHITAFNNLVIDKNDDLKHGFIF